MTEIAWRDYEPRDKEAVEKLHHQMEARVGRKMDLPDLDAQPVLIAQVGVVDGAVTYCVYAEAEIEVCAAGCAPLSAKQMAPAVKRLTEVAAGYNLRIARCFVPQSMLKPTKRGKKVRQSPLARTLKKLGFRREKKSRMTDWFKWL